VHDDKRSGRPSVVTPDLVQRIEVKIRENHHGSGRTIPICVTENCSPDCE
jgi:hypothetical protein